MNNISVFFRKSFLLLVAILSLTTSLLVVSAQLEDKLSGVSFPIAELGNCDSRESCRAYCDMTEHMNACISFAKKHDLMNEEEARRAETFSSKLSTGSGPGGCDSPQSCRTYCEDLANMETCLSFAEEHDLEAGESKEAKKIVMYLKSGGTMPGGCTSRASCERYCGDFSHAEECFKFAKKAGLAQGAREGQRGNDMPNEEQFKKLMELAKKGETPGGCTSKESCEDYCKAGEHTEECLSFAEKVGFIDKEKAEKLKKLGGRGPGGCNSEESCHAYCGDPANQEACFAFAKENGLMDEGELEHMKEEMIRKEKGPESDFRMNERQLPQKDYENERRPQTDQGFRREGATMRSGEMPVEAQGGWIARLPHEIQVCLKEKIGENYLSLGKAGPSEATEEVLRVCFSQKGQKDMGGSQDGERGQVFPSFPLNREVPRTSDYQMQGSFQKERRPEPFNGYGGGTDGYYPPTTTHGEPDMLQQQGESMPMDGGIR